MSKKYFGLYQKTNLLTDSTKDFGDKIGEKTKLYSHTAEAFSPILAQKTKLNRKQQSSSRDLFFGIQPIEQKLSNLLKPIFSGSKKEFILINNLVKNWQEIVGKKYVEFSYPKSVSFNKDKSSGAKLVIAVHNSAVGFFLENNAEIILERIAVFYGFKSITKISIKQEPKNIRSGIATPAKLTAQEENFLAEKIGKISDQNLAETLQNLGREILRDDDSLKKIFPREQR